MENENMPSLENSNDGRRARGKRLPLQIRNRIKPIEGKHPCERLPRLIRLTKEIYQEPPTETARRRI